MLKQLNDVAVYIVHDGSNGGEVALWQHLFMYPLSVRLVSKIPTHSSSLVHVQTESSSVNSSFP